jgi:hypothetical protein
MAGENEKLIFDSGRLPLWIRLLLGFIGMLMLAMFAELTSLVLFDHDLFGLHPVKGPNDHPVFGLFICFAMGSGFVSTWFLRKQLTCEASHNQIVLRGRGLFGRCLEQRVSMADVKEVHFCYHQGGVIGGSPRWHIWLVSYDGKKSLLALIGRSENDGTPEVFAEVTHLPVLKV